MTVQEYCNNNPNVKTPSILYRNTSVLTASGKFVFCEGCVFFISGKDVLKENVTKGMLVATDVRSWGILPNEKIIYNQTKDDYESNNKYIIGNKDGVEICHGGISPDGDLVFFDGGSFKIYSPYNDAKVLFSLKYHPDEIEYLKTYICVSANTDCNINKHFIFYSYGGKIDEKATKRDRIYSLMGKICLALTDTSKVETIIFNRRICRCEMIDPFDFLEDISCYEDVTFEEVEWTANKLNEKGILSDISFKRYLQLKEFFKKLGYSKSIELPLTNVMIANKNILENLGKHDKAIVCQELIQNLNDLNERYTPKNLKTTIESLERLLMEVN